MIDFCPSKLLKAKQAEFSFSEHFHKKTFTFENAKSFVFIMHSYKLFVLMWQVKASNCKHLSPDIFLFLIRQKVKKRVLIGCLL